MIPDDDCEVSGAQKPEEGSEILDYEAYENVDKTSLSSANEGLKTSSVDDGKDSTFKDKGNNGVNSFSQACDEEDDDDNLFKLSVLFVRGNPFDSLKHWRMRSGFLETNLRISSLGRIREVDEEILNISEQEIGSRSRVRLIQVETKHEELGETEQTKYEESSQELNEFSPEAKSSSCTVPNDLERTKPDLTSLKHIACESAVVNETKDSVTSLADAAFEQDERKTSSSNSFLPEAWTMDQTPTKSSPQETVHSESDQTEPNAERPGLFTKILRRVIALLQGRKNDVWPVENSQRQSTTTPQSSV